MSRFSEAERDRIREELVEEGRQLFSQYGFERTRIKDVTEAVGIGTSTFYQFFDSKEALYGEVLRVESEALDARIEDAIADTETHREEVRVVLREVFEEVRTNPLISRLIIEDELRVLKRQLSDAEQRSLATEADGGPPDYVERWTADPAFRYDDPELVNGLIRSLVFSTRGQDVAEAYAGAGYEEIEEALIDTVVDGLFVDDPEPVTP